MAVTNTLFNQRAFTLTTFWTNLHKVRLSLKFIFICFLLCTQSTKADVKIPDLGDGSSGLISPAQEYKLGQNWLRAYRAQIPTSKDPFLQTYVEQLIQNIATYSDLEDKRLDILVVENPNMNAFAVPGGIIGVHTGLFSFAQTEHQFSSVIAHEIAHLSQRHYARTLQQQKNRALPTMAALLASILVAVTTGGDAGIAAISTVQAAAIDAQLRFSRQMEREADRIGMETMVRADMNPYAMPEMFEQMLHATRFQKRPPEFLLTHPVTESRVSDSKLRAQKFPQRQHVVSKEFQLVKARARLLHEKNTQVAIKTFEAEIEYGESQQATLPSQYGLVLALTKAGRTEDARKTLEPLMKEMPDHLFFKIAEAEIESEAGNHKRALAILKKLIKSYPNYHPLVIRYAELLMRAGEYDTSEQLLERHAERRPNDDYVWYLLAEVHGLAGHILKVHTARAEYFLLNGLFEQAEIQWLNALKLTKKNKHQKARLEQRLKETRELKAELEL